MFSIIIPTWNNLPYLKLCIDSIRKNSEMMHQIVVHVNDGSDGTIEYLNQENIPFTHSRENIGICLAVNEATQYCTNEYIVYMNDDMYVCPNWDKYIMDEIKKIGHDLFMLSGTLIEPNDTGNKCVIVQNYGDNLENFDEQSLLNQYHLHPHQNWKGSAWPPTIVSRKMWLKAGAYSIEFSPGLSSDDDFAMKMWQMGCRIFMGVSQSRIYHFQAKSTNRIEKNNGRLQFLKKWNLKQSSFNRYFIQRGDKYEGPLETPPPALIKKEQQKAKWKLFYHFLKGDR